MKFSKIASVVVSAFARGATAPKSVSAKFDFPQGDLTKFAKSFLLGATTLAIICPTVANASQDPGVYPGAACQPSNSSYLFRRDIGAVYNGSTATQSWVCPVERDFEDSGSIEYGQVTVLQSSSGQRPNCSLYSRTEEGQLVGLTAATVYSSGTAGVYKLRFGLGASNAIKVAQYGHVYFYCSLPGGSGILNYRITENVGED